MAEERQRFADSLPSGRAQTFDDLKIEAIRESPLNIVVTSTLERGGAHVLGRYTQPEMAHYSTCLAIENLWLTARAEGLGVGWVSFYRPSVLSGSSAFPITSCRSPISVSATSRSSTRPPSWPCETGPRPGH